MKLPRKELQEIDEGKAEMRMKEKEKKGGETSRIGRRPSMSKA